MTESSTQSLTLLALAEITAAHPFARKLLVCRTPAQGRELLRALTSSGTPWIGWETTTPRQLAYDLAAHDLTRSGLRTADDFDLAALADESIDEVQAQGMAGPFSSVAGALGYRELLRRALTTLRRAGLGPNDIDARRDPDDSKLAAVAEILRAYESGLGRKGLIDPPGVMRMACAAVREGRAALPEGRIYLLSGQVMRGVMGEFIELLLEQGAAEILPADVGPDAALPPALLWKTTSSGASGPAAAASAPHPADQVSGLAAGISSAPPEGAPTTSAVGGSEAAGNADVGELPPGHLSDRIFAAATPADELREVLRRVLERGIPWDQVEIVATDPFTYGAALDSIARRLGIPVTYSAGLDTRRTRVGRAVAAFMRWLGEGLPADVIRELLEAGDLAPPKMGEGISGTGLARRLRRLRVGWGRERYLPAIERTLEALREAPLDAELDVDEASSNRARQLRELEALHQLLEPIIEAIPDAPDRARTRRVITSPAALAEALLVFLDFVPAGDLVENNTRKIITDRLRRVRATLTRETGWESALAILQSRIETRTAPAGEGGLAPWTSIGGFLHLADIENGGLGGRPWTFVVGLDSARVTGSGATDPILTDSDRALLNRGHSPARAPLPTTADRVQETRFELAALLARLRGEVTLSYSAWDMSEGRAISPAPELLAELRRLTGDESLSYDDLRHAHGPLACAVPRGRHPIDAVDLWLAALWNDGVLRRGDDLVREVYPDLARGHTAALLRAGDEPTHYHGILSRRPELDSELEEGIVYSATRLEALGSCPRRFFYRYVLDVKVPDDPEWDPESWLTALERGTLLHEVYESTLEAAKDRGLDPDDVAFEELAREILQGAVERMTHRVPPPSMAVHAAEVAALEEDLQVFVSLIRTERPDWMELELSFGPDADHEAAVEIGGRRVRIRGAIDRVDRLESGRLRVVDYKTGSHRQYRSTRPFHGGRRIQHILYMRAAESILGEEVESMEYHFPTRRGKNERIRYGREVLGMEAEVLDKLFGIARDGHFITTEDHNDCRYCAFTAVCRTRIDDYGGVRSPEVAWVKDNIWPKKPRKGEAPAEVRPEYRRLHELRGIDG